MNTKSNRHHKPSRRRAAYHPPRRPIQIVTLGRHGSAHPPVSAPDCALSPTLDVAASHAHLVDQVANLAVVVVQLWEQNNGLREALGLPRVNLPLAGSMMCVAWRGAPTPDYAR